jgi:hypothetical protein
MANQKERKKKEEDKDLLTIEFDRGDNCDIYYSKTTHFFMCSHFKFFKGSLSRA